MFSLRWMPGFVVLWSLLGASTAVAQLTDNGDGTVTDQRTGLMWLKESQPSLGQPGKNLIEAREWADALDTGGHTDWRLPSALDAQGRPDMLWDSTNNEWGSLYGTTWGNPASTDQIAPMTNYPCCFYWTDTVNPADPGVGAGFFISYDGIWLNDWRPAVTQLRYTAVRGVAAPMRAAACSDGADNDHDGATDFPADTNCSDPQDGTETTFLIANERRFMWVSLALLMLLFWLRTRRLHRYQSAPGPVV